MGRAFNFPVDFRQLYWKYQDILPYVMGPHFPIQVPRNAHDYFSMNPWKAPPPLEPIPPKSRKRPGKPLLNSKKKLRKKLGLDEETKKKRRWKRRTGTRGRYYQARRWKTRNVTVPFKNA